MVLQNLLGTSAYDSDPDIEEILARFDPYIVAEVEKLLRRSSNVAHPEVLDLEIAEIAQQVRIKLWRVLKKERQIEYPKAYILRMVKNEFIDFIRKRKPYLPLPTDEDGEIYMGNVVLTKSEGMSDPADEYEKEEGLNNWMALAALVVSNLSQRQKHAMICLLKERIGNCIQLMDEFEKYQIDIDVFEWPEDKIDETRLKASISAARQNIAERLGMPLSEYKKRGIPEALLFINLNEAKVR
jgi:DNA-directed RNA polymerase specialized sigma24 family protein